MPEGPTTRRRQLGFRLHALREGSGLTAEEAGRRAGVSKATVSRYERAKGTVRWSHVDQLCRVYGLPDAEREALVELAKHSTETDGWWVSQADNLPSCMAMLLALEHESTHIEQFSPVVLPGLLQTREYAKAIKQSGPHLLSEGDTERLLDVRMHRQQLLCGPIPEYRVVLDESVLRRVVANPGTTTAQLAHLQQQSQKPHVTIQVLPFAAGVSTAAMNGFLLVGGAQPELDVVYVENLAGSLYLEGPGPRRAFSAAFEQLCHEALAPADSAALIESVAAAHLEHERTTS
ncbi:helix-turn-helix domain-containing protein [Streptomyces sulphureus]|uniref:helix-turn-helix domain-containing protein n=1 Tax=Streptomyces sulphureus TaxID=47758 RepID=UPI0003A18B5C|nr:helix-turn-helix transcriptional regulator [Streptomyces sulphureus]